MKKTHINNLLVNIIRSCWPSKIWLCSRVNTNKSKLNVQLQPTLLRTPFSLCWKYRNKNIAHNQHLCTNDIFHWPHPIHTHPIDCTNRTLTFSDLRKILLYARRPDNCIEPQLNWTQTVIFDSTSTFVGPYPSCYQSMVERCLHDFPMQSKIIELLWHAQRTQSLWVTYRFQLLDGLADRQRFDRRHVNWCPIRDQFRNITWYLHGIPIHRCDLL